MPSSVSGCESGGIGPGGHARAHQAREAIRVRTQREVSAMVNVENRVILAARDAGVIELVSQAAAAEQIALQHFDSASAWLASIANDPHQPPDERAPRWVDCLVCQAETGADDLDANVERALELRRGLATVLIAQHATIDGAVRAMRSGASSVLMMPAPVDMVRQLLREAHRLAAKRRPALVEQFTAQKRLATLTDEELAVLEHLLVGMVNKEIARRESIGLRTAELRRARILKKMGAGSLAELVRMVCAARGVVLPWHE